MATSISRRSLLKSGAGAGIALTLGTLPDKAAATWTAGSPRFAGDPGPGRLFYGASADTSIWTWEQRMGQRLALHRTYHKAGEVDRLVDTARTDLKMDRLPHVSTKCPGTWKAVALGTHDGWLRRIGLRLAALEQPVFFTLHHEPENNARPDGRRPRHFVAMQRHAIAMFAALAPNVTVVPVLQGWTFARPDTGRDPAVWVVAEAAVFGVDIYNPFCSTDRTWVPFAERLDQMRPYAGGRPIAIGEYGCREDSRDPERAVAWMHDTFEYALANNVVSLSYFNSARNSPDGSWRLTEERARAFREILAAPEVVRPTSA